MDKKVLTKLEVETWLDMQISLYETHTRAKKLTDSIYAILGARDKHILIHGTDEICKVLDIIPLITECEEKGSKFDEIEFYYNNYIFIEYIEKGVMNNGK